MFKEKLCIVLILLSAVIANAASTVKMKQAKISGTVIKLGQGADIVQSRIQATKYIPGPSYGDSSKGYYTDNGITYIVTYGLPPSGDGVYVVRKIEKIVK